MNEKAPSPEAAPALEAEPRVPAGWQVQLRRELAGLSLADQRRRLSPPEPRKPVQLSEDPAIDDRR